MRVGLIYTGATEEMLREAPELTLNMADPPEVIEAVKQALEAGGHTVVAMNTDRRLPAMLADAPIDIAFNIATGLHGENCQANVPAMLDYLRIPHTGSSVFAEALTQDKPTMKTVLRARGLPTPDAQVMTGAGDALDAALRFPLIVKPPAGGGSLGLTRDSVVQNEADLRKQVGWLLDKYGQGALVEAYINGREFTVSVLGNDPPYALPIVERLYFGEIRIQLDEPEVSELDLYRQWMGREYTYTSVDGKSVAPADVPEETAERIRQMTIGAYRALGCRDWARIDLRMDGAGNLYILDVNLEPAIARDYALDKAAQAAGWSYTTLVNRIFDHAIERYAGIRGA